MEDLFFSKNRIYKLGPMRVIYFLLFALIFVLTEIGRKIYRPYIYQNGIYDYGFADVIGNLLGTAAIIFFSLAVYHANRIQSIRIIVFVTIGVVLYELLQPVLPRGVLDWKDVFSTFIAGLFALFIISIVWRYIQDPLTTGDGIED